MRPKKSLGQNFLRDEAVLEKIIAAANLSGDETVVEVGAGEGALTQALEDRLRLTDHGSQKIGQILALEFDYRLVERLRAKFKNHRQVKIIHQDALKFNWEDLPPGYVVVANLPYQITSPLVNLWTNRLKNQSRSITIMVQKEVAERLTAPPGSSDRGLTTILVELYGEAKIIATVPATAFFPVPKVDSALIKIQYSKFKSQNCNSKFKINKRAIIAIAKAGFSSKRRTLLNSLSGSLRLPHEQVSAILEKADIKPTLRAEDLSVEQWETLAQLFKNQYSIVKNTS